MPVTARSTPNIALIKYWGNRNDELRLPAADSLSMTLDRPSVEVTIEHSPTLAVRSFEADGTERGLSTKHLARFEKHLELTKRYFTRLGIPEAMPESVSIEIRSEISPGIGLASSAAVFSTIAEAYAALAKPMRDLTRREVSVIARLGSGSAARSVVGGFAAMDAGEGDALDAAAGRQVAPPEHWPLHDIIIVPSQAEKKYGSTEGHSFARTSPLFRQRLTEIPGRQRECIHAIKTKDFEKLQRVAEEDCLDMHAVMRTSTPPLEYLTEDTHQIVAALTAFRDREHLPVLYTMDAGPTVHLIFPAEAAARVRGFAGAFKEFLIVEAGVGPGSHIV